MPLVDIAILIATLSLTSIAIQSPRLAAAAAKRRASGEHSRHASDRSRFPALATSALLYACSCTLAIAAYILGRWLESEGWTVVGQGTAGGAFLTACFLAASLLLVAADTGLGTSTRDRSAAPWITVYSGRASGGLIPQSLKRASAVVVAVVWFPAIGSFLVAALTLFAASLIWQVIWLAMQFWRLAGGAPIPASLQDGLLAVAFVGGFSLVLLGGVREFHKRRADIKATAPSWEVREAFFRKCDTADAAFVLPAALITILVAGWLSVTGAYWM